MAFYALTRQGNGRIVLTHDLLTRDHILLHIEAADWKAARAQVKEAPYWNTQGEGWFER